MVFVKGGTFIMGCTSEQSDCGDDEEPTHPVMVSDFYMGKNEVTQKQWFTVMDRKPVPIGFYSLLKGISKQIHDSITDDQIDSIFNSYSDNYNNFLDDYSKKINSPISEDQKEKIIAIYNLNDNSICFDCPAEVVSWNDVQAFIKKLNQKTGKNYRLPTEAEWEYAAHGGSTGLPTTYTGSNNIDEVAWYTSNSGSKTHPVGQKKPNALGIYDMSGNVWEWCSDWYGSDYYKSSPSFDPKGPSSGSSRVYRGDSCDDSPQYCRVANRGGSGPDYRFSNLGFRLSRMP